MPDPAARASLSPKSRRSSNRSRPEAREGSANAQSQAASNAPSAPSHASEISDEEVFALYATVRGVNRRFKTSQVTVDRAGRHPLAESDLEALFIIDEHGQCTAGHLAKALSVAPATATTLVDRLVDRRLVNRSRSEVDRRSVWLKLTKPGRRALHESRADLLRVCRAVLGCLSSAERRSFVALLHKLGSAELAAAPRGRKPR